MYFKFKFDFVTRLFFSGLGRSKKNQYMVSYVPFILHRIYCTKYALLITNQIADILLW